MALHVAQYVLYALQSYSGLRALDVVLWYAPAPTPFLNYIYPNMGGGALGFMLALFTVWHKKAFHRLCIADVSLGTWVLTSIFPKNPLD